MNFPIRYLDTIDSDTGVLNKISALNLIVFGPKLEHLDLIEYVIVDLLKVKWETFVKREFFKQMGQFTVFFILAITAFITRPLVPEDGCNNSQEDDDLNETLTTSTGLDWYSKNLTMEFSSNWTDSLFDNETCKSMTESMGLGDCYLYKLDSEVDVVRCVCEVLIVIFSLLFILKALRELSFLGLRVFMENMQLCPSRVIFLISCFLLQVRLSQVNTRTYLFFMLSVMHPSKNFLFL